MKAIKDTFKTLFQRITPLKAVTTELAEAEMNLLRAETGVEYAQSLVAYNKARVKRLSAYLKEQETS